MEPSTKAVTDVAPCVSPYDETYGATHDETSMPTLFVMTTTVPAHLLADLDALKRRAATDPEISRSPSRIKRLGTVVSLLGRAAEDVDPDQRTGVAALLAPDVIGHPTQPDTILGRAVTGRYRRRPGPDPLTPATQRAVMDGLADLNRAAGRAPYWWQINPAQRADKRPYRTARPHANHTLEPMTPKAHRVLRRALSTPYGNPTREAFRLRTLAMLELMWDTAVEPEGAASADVTDLTDDLSEVTLTFNPPGRTEAVVATVPLGAAARAALRAWLPVRRRVIAEHLDAGPDHPANQALFITLKTTTGTYPDSGLPRHVPPGLRISTDGLLTQYRATARRFNAEHHGQPGWPVPTGLYAITRGAAAVEG